MTARRQECRVRWQRVGLPKRTKIYQTRRGAEEWIETLTGSWDGFLPQGYEDGEVPELIAEPVIEIRDVGEWRVEDAA